MQSQKLLFLVNPIVICSLSFITNVLLYMNSQWGKLFGVSQRQYPIAGEQKGHDKTKKSLKDIRQ